MIKHVIVIVSVWSLKSFNRFLRSVSNRNYLHIFIQGMSSIMFDSLNQSTQYGELPIAPIKAWLSPSCIFTSPEQLSYLTCNQTQPRVRGFEHLLTKIQENTGCQPLSVSKPKVQIYWEILYRCVQGTHACKQAHQSILRRYLSTITITSTVSTI